jgi:hypothetical protein
MSAVSGHASETRRKQSKRDEVSTFAASIRMHGRARKVGRRWTRAVYVTRRRGRKRVTCSGATRYAIAVLDLARPRAVREGGKVANWSLLGNPQENRVGAVAQANDLHYPHAESAEPTRKARRHEGHRRGAEAQPCAHCTREHHRFRGQPALRGEADGLCIGR